MKHLVALCAVVLLAGCGSDETSPETARPVTPSNTPAATQPVPTTAATTVAGGSPSQREVALALINSWKAGDREGAAANAEPAAIAALFRVPFQSEAAVPEIQVCEKNAGFDNLDTCSFAYPGGSMHFIQSPSKGWKVERVEYVAD